MEQTIPTKYYRIGVDYVGGFGGGAVPPQGSIEVPFAPKDARAQWDVNITAWIEPVQVEDEKIEQALLEEEISLRDRVVALEKKIMENDSTEADAIQAIKEDAK